MRTLLGNSNLLDKYEIIDDNTLSFKDKVLKFYEDIDFKTINDFDHELKLSGDEVDCFKEYLESMRDSDERILVVSDYDCDGICAYSIFSRLLDYLHIEHNYYIPSRSKEGYGINIDIVKRAKKYGFKAIITLDNGVVANEAIALAKEYGIDFLIIDHHNYETRPEVKALIHPYVLDAYHGACCASGLSYCFALNYYDDEYSSVLAGIATLADMVEVFKANRELIIRAYKRLKTMTNTPINMFLGNKNDFEINDLNFKVIPKINAISRMDHLTNVNLFARFIKNEVVEDFTMLKRVEEINDLRKNISKDSAAKALNTKLNENGIIVLKSKQYLEGLCGLIANQVMNKVKRPAIVLSELENCYKGSGRSPRQFDIHQYLNAWEGEYLAFGGHAQAVGLTIDKKDINLFETYCGKALIGEDLSKTRVIEITMDDLTIENIEFLESLAPYGQGFKEATFLLKDPMIRSKFLIKGLYPKYSLENGVEAICFDKDLYYDDVKGFIGQLSFNKFQARRKINVSIDEIVL